ncbi:cysteine hydrolase [Polaromonas sp. P1-6]|nr:cysteine hydrolase [Polaromonas sp. P1-6]
MSTPADYIRAFMPERPVHTDRAALLIIDMQYATGSRQGALGRKLKAEGSSVGDYRFARIEQSVVPNTLRLRELFTSLGRPVVHVTIGAALPHAGDAPVHMRKLFIEFNNIVGSREHEIIDELKPLPGEHVLRKTTIGAFASTNIDSLLRAGVRSDLPGRCVHQYVRGDHRTRSGRPWLPGDPGGRCLRHHPRRPAPCDHAQLSAPLWPGPLDRRGFA